MKFVLEIAGYEGCYYYSLEGESKEQLEADMLAILQKYEKNSAEYWKEHEKRVNHHSTDEEKIAVSEELYAKYLKGVSSIFQKHFLTYSTLFEDGQLSYKIMTLDEFWEDNLGTAEEMED